MTEPTGSELARAYESGSSLNALAKKCGRSRDWVRLRLAEVGASLLPAKEAMIRAKLKHGASGRPRDGVRPDPLYKIWAGMIRRCECPTDPKYRFYGARGITVCRRWRKSFEDFRSDVGPRPPGRVKGVVLYTLDRIDNNGNYEPGNVRWATRKQQTRNRRMSRYVVIDGERVHFREACERFGVSYGTAKQRLRLGWEPRRAAMTPVKGPK